MLTIHEIEQAITKLPQEELTRFREWFDEFEAKGWDKQFEADVKAGKLESLAQQAVSEFRAGDYKEL